MRHVFYVLYMCGCFVLRIKSGGGDTPAAVTTALRLNRLHTTVSRLLLFFFFFTFQIQLLLLLLSFWSPGWLLGRTVRVATLRLADLVECNERLNSSAHTQLNTTLSV